MENIEIKERAQKILRILNRSYPDAVCALRHENPFQLLIATILSAQCTDARVNLVTPQLFVKFPSPEAFAKAEPEVVEQEIRSTGFYRAKTKSIIGASQQIVSRFQGQVPHTMEDLTGLPGVARKTANVVLGTGFGIASGIVVDTHVARISERLGLTRHQDPAKIEQDLMLLLPQASWILFSHQVIIHGRRICTARKPQCPACPLFKLCDYGQCEQTVATARKLIHRTKTRNART